MATSIPDIGELTEEQAQTRVTQFDQELSRLLGRAGNDPQSMIDLQVLITKRNQAYEQLAEIQRKLQQSIDGIVGNMR